MVKLMACIGTLMLMLTLTVSAQERTIEGVVTDSEGAPLKGVTVVVDGTQLSTQTDEKGHYKLESVPETAQTLRFSHPDMEDASATIGIYNTVDIKMSKLGSDDQELYSLEDLLNMEVITASKKAEKNTDAPGIISTITKEEIKYFGATNLNDILERAVSIQKVGSHLFPNSVSAIRGDLRTLYDNHVLLLLNGRPVREGVSGGINSPVYLGFPVEMIERIEIIRGPGSVLYGTNAFAGVINIITNSNKSKNSFGINATGGSFNTIGGSINGSLVKNDFTAKVNARLDNVEGWDFEAVTARPGAENLTIDKKYGRMNAGVATEVSYKGLSFTGLYTSDNQDVLGILPYASFEGRNKISRLFLNLGYTYEINESWETSVNVTHNSSDMKLNDEAVIPFDHQENSDYLAEVTVNGEPLKNLNLVVGGVIDMRNKNNTGDNDAIPITYNQTHLSAYIQTDYSPVEMIKLIAGAQLNKPDIGNTDIVPRLGAIFHLSDNLGIKTLYASAFRSPWPIEQLLVNPAFLGNANLKPEKISTIDLQLFYSTKNAEGSITYFNSNYSNSISRAPIEGQPGVFTYINQGELTINGFEFEGKVTVSSNIFVTASTTLQNNADEETVPVYIPDFMAKAGVFYKTDFGLTTGLFNTYFGKPKENNGAVVNPEAEAMDLLSLNIDYELPTSLPLKLSIYVQNILNNTYYYTEFSRGWVNTLPLQPGATIYGKIGLRF